MIEGRRAVFSLVALCAAVAACAGSAASSRSASRGKLVLVGVNFEAAGLAQAGLYVMNGDGSGLRQITHNPGDEQPHWSPDGRSIAFVRAVGLTGGVMVMNADGSALRHLGSSYDSSLAAPSPWSPDGKQIAWSGCGGLCIYNLTTSRQTPLRLGSEDIWGFAWAPDGRALAAVGEEGLVVVGTTGRIIKVLSAAGQYPAWSPDGKQIAFLAGPATSANTLEVVPAAGGRARIIGRNAYGPPAWSRDGRSLLYTDLIRHPFSTSVRVVNMLTHTNTRVDANAGIARWSPDGATLAYGRRPFPGGGQDVWFVQPNGTNRHQLTGEFPTGLSYSDLDWTSGQVPAGTAVSPPDLLHLEATSELKLDSLDGSIGRAGTPDSVVYEVDRLCDPDAETVSATLNVWTPSTGRTITSSTPCQDWQPAAYAVTSTLQAWISQSDMNGNETLAAMRPGTTEAGPIAQWTSGEESPDIGWRAGIGWTLGGGSTIVFGTGTGDGTSQLWRIVDGLVPHAVPIPLPPDGSDLLDADAGGIVIRTTHKDLAVLSTDGMVLSRIPVLGTARIGGELVGVAARSTFRVYDAHSGALREQLPLAHTAGLPGLLTIGTGYAVYTSGIELHLVRLDNGNDRIVDLPGQAGPLQALLTADGLFIAYFHGYEAHPARLLFVPTANLP